MDIIIQYVAKATNIGQAGDDLSLIAPFHHLHREVAAGRRTRLRVCYLQSESQGVPSQLI